MLGFTIYPIKSLFVPSQNITFLKKLKLKNFTENLLVVIMLMREVASFLGNLSAVFEAVPYGRLMNI